MGFSYSKFKKGKAKKTNNIQKTNLDKNNKNLITNDNHSNNTGIIIKSKKMNELENIKCEKNIEKSIKSLYILKDIFSFLPEAHKLRIMIYNKNLQKRFDINIEDYKRITRKYKEGERNGKGKEYDIKNNSVLFEGEYKNGKKWNSKGKEFYKIGELIINKNKIK